MLIVFHRDGAVGPSFPQRPLEPESIPRIERPLDGVGIEEELSDEIRIRPIAERRISRARQVRRNGN